VSVFPTENEILRLNGRVADLLVKPQGVKDPQMLRAILLGVRISRSANGPRSDIFFRAAALIHQMVQLEPFVAANGATAIGASLLYLSRHGFRVSFSRGQAAAMMLGVRDGSLDQDRIAATFRAMAGKAPMPPPGAAAPGSGRALGSRA